MQRMSASALVLGPLTVALSTAALHAQHRHVRVHVWTACVTVRTHLHGGMQGPTAAQARQDSNAFESAQRSWADKSVSSRGKVGAAGDTKGFSWLG